MKNLDGIYQSAGQILSKSEKRRCLSWAVLAGLLLGFVAAVFIGAANDQEVKAAPGDPVVGMFAADSLIISANNVTGTAAGNANLGLRQPNPDANDLMVAFIAIRPSASTVNTPASWSTAGNWVGTDGAAERADTGSVRFYWFYKVATGSEGYAKQTFTENGTTSVWQGKIIKIRSAAGTYNLSAGGYSINGDNTNWNGTLDTDIGLTARDLVLIAGAQNGNLSNTSAWGISAAGVNSVSTVYEEGEYTTTTGNDQETGLATANIWGGTSTAAPSITLTQSAAASGVVSAIRVRQGAGTNRTDTFIRSASAKISGTTSVAVPYPSHEVGDLLVLIVVNRYNTATPSTPAGWSTLGTYVGGYGTNGADAGQSRSTAFYRQAASLYTGTQSVTVTSGNVSLGQMFSIHCDGVSSWVTDSDGGADNTPGTGWSVTGSGIDLDSSDGGDVILAVSSINTDTYTYSSPGISASGVIITGVAFNSETRDSQGYDMSMEVVGGRVTSGSAAGATPTATLTASSSGTNAPAGSAIFIKVKAADTAVVTVSSSGSQVANMNIPSSDNYVGGAFTFVRSASSADVTQIIVAETNDVNANANLSNLKLFYKQEASCSGSIPGDATVFNGTGVGFNGSEKATVTGTMAVGTAQICLYAQLDVGSGASGDQLLDLEITNPSADVTVSSGTVSPATPVAIADFTTLVSTNNNPNSPSALAQKKTDDSVIATGQWVSTTSIKYTATVSDPESDQVQLCVEKDPLGTSFSGSEDLCGSLVGSGQTASVTISSQTDATQYHWQARAKDDNGAYSLWVLYGGNGEEERDYGLDTTAPNGGSVYDGTSGDQDWNDGLLTQLSANWTGFDASVSGLDKYEYALRRKLDDNYWSVCSGAGAWQAGANWCNNGTSTSITQNNLNLQTGVIYYVSVRATDNAGNIASPVNSNGQQVSPILSFMLSGNSITFDNLNNANNWTDSQQATVTTSTNASAGYFVKAYITDYLRSSTYTEKYVSDFIGTWAAPAAWSNYCKDDADDCGFGYTSNDPLVQGSNRFGSGLNYAGYVHMAPGDVVADHTDAVNGSTGAVSNEAYTITYKMAVSPSQSASAYRTYAVYIVTANY